MSAVPGDHLTEKGRRTRARLLEVAGQELFDRGQIEVAAVAERAGVSVGLLYRYFANKDELVTALVDEFYDRNVKLLLSAAAEPRALYTGKRLTFDFDRTISRLAEMQSAEYLALPHLA